MDSDPREYLRHVMKTTNMSCLTPEGALEGECDFLSANMYARSLFGKHIICPNYLEECLRDCRRRGRVSKLEY